MLLGYFGRTVTPVIENVLYVFPTTQMYFLGSP
jgi:hypothetical protein